MSQKHSDEDRQLTLNFEHSCFPDLGIVATAPNVFHLSSFRCPEVRRDKSEQARSAEVVRTAQNSSDEEIIRHVLIQAKHLSW